jgi:DUF1680 family protein
MKMYITGGIGSDPSIEGFGPRTTCPTRMATLRRAPRSVWSSGHSE